MAIPSEMLILSLCFAATISLAIAQAPMGAPPMSMTMPPPSVATPPQTKMMPPTMASAPMSTPPSPVFPSMSPMAPGPGAPGPGRGAPGPAPSASSIPGDNGATLHGSSIAIMALLGGLALFA